MRSFLLRKLAPALVCTLSIALLLSAQTRPKDEPQATRPRADAHVVIVSVDGLPPDYYTDSASLGLRVPNLTRMKLSGAYAGGVEGVYPSVTYPSHTTMATGVRPAVHGIVQNRIFEAPTELETRAWYWYAGALKSETLWALAKNAGLVTAAVGWPVTVGADIDYNVPEFWDLSETPMTMRQSRSLSTPGLIARALETTGGREPVGDEFRTVVSEYIVEHYRPNLLLVHLIELDDTHHKSGPRTSAALETAEREDGYIGRIVEATRKAGVFDKTTFFVVSDHGFAKVQKKFYPGVVLVKEKLITLGANGKPVSWKAAAWPAGGSCAIVLRDPADKDTATKVAAAFTRLASRDRGPLARVVTRPEMDRLGAIPQAVLMLEAAPGYAVGEGYTGAEVRDSGDSYRGSHGYLPSRAEMRASLILYGQGVRVGARIPLARMIDIGPTAAALLSLNFSNAEGTPIEELLRPGVAPPSAPRSRKKEGKPNT